MIPHSRPSLGDDDARAVARVVLGGHVAQGPEVAAFEAFGTSGVMVAIKADHREQLRSLGAGPMTSALTLIWDTRFSLVTIVLAGFGRAAAEVGAVMIVGGNIDGVTRVMTTAIALETSKGDLPLALGLGMILLSLVLALNAAAYWVKEAAQLRYG